MDVRHFKMIIEVARYGNLTKAADQLCVTQSALSHQLKDVETTFSSRLFDRRKRSMKLTDAGKLALELSERVIAQIDQTRKDIHSLVEKNIGQIRISTKCHLSYYWLANFLQDFKKVFPNVEVIILPEAVYDSTNYLLDDKLDIAITDDTINNKLTYHPLFKDELTAVVSNSHPWANFKWVDLELFHTEPYLMYDIPFEMSKSYQMIFGERPPKKLYRLRITEAILQMVKANMGVTVLPYWVARPYVESGELSAIPLTRKGIFRNWYAATIRHVELPVYTKDFLNLLAKNMSQPGSFAKLAVYKSAKVA